MATSKRDENYLTGDELEEYLDNLLGEEESTGEDSEGEDTDWVEREENNICTCGKPASQHRARCTMMHFICESETEFDVMDVDRPSSSTTANYEANLCQCCQILMDTDELEEPQPQPKPPTESEASKKTTLNKSQPKPKRKGPAVRPSALYVEENALNDCEQFLIDGVKSIEGNRLYNRPNVKRAKSIVYLAAVVERQAMDKTNAFCNFSSFLAKQLWTVVTAGGQKLGGASEAKVIKKLIPLRVDDTLRSLWKDLLGDEANNASHTSLLLYLVRYIFSSLLKKRNDVDLPNVPGHLAGIDLSESDEQVLRYASGYIPFALIKLYGRQHNNNAKAMRAFLLGWKVPHDSESEDVGTFLQYTRNWVDKVNRGNLFTFNDNVYMFFRSMEIETRKCLTKQALMSPDVYDQLMEKLDTNVYIQRCWDSLVKDQLQTHLASKLLKTIKFRWAKMRVNAYITVYFLLKNMKDTKTRKGEKSLRKELRK